MQQLPAQVDAMHIREGRQESHGVREVFATKISRFEVFVLNPQAPE